MIAISKADEVNQEVVKALKQVLPLQDELLDIPYFFISNLFYERDFSREKLIFDCLHCAAARAVTTARQA